MSRALRECPVPGCHRQHQSQHLMCGTHWRAVPKKLKDEVWRTVHNVLSHEYQDARDAAISSVTPVAASRGTRAEYEGFGEPC